MFLYGLHKSEDHEVWSGPRAEQRRVLRHPQCEQAAHTPVAGESSAEAAAFPIFHSQLSPCLDLLNDEPN